MDLLQATQISATGLTAQRTKMKVIAENLANAGTAAGEAGGAPYRRKVITFKNALDKATGVHKVRVEKITTDNTKLERKYDPGHPAADETGYVTLPNVKTMVEMMDMKQAQRSFEANLSIIQAAKTMLQKTIDLLRA